MIHKLQKCPSNSSERKRDRKRIAGSFRSALRSARLRSRFIFNEKNRWPARFPQCVPHYVWIRLTIALNLDERITDLKGKIRRGLPYHFSSMSARIWIAPRETRNANGALITRLVRASYCTTRKDAARSVFPIRHQNIAEKCRNWYRQKNKEEKLSRDTQRDGTFFPDVVAQRIFHALSRSNGPRPCEIDRHAGISLIGSRISFGRATRSRNANAKSKSVSRENVAGDCVVGAATLRSRGRSEGNVEECKPLLRVHARTESERMIELFGKIPPRRISRGQETGFRIRYWSNE